MSSGTLLDKVWKIHTAREMPNGMTQLVIGRHYIHEVTSPPAFKMLDDDELPVAHPELAIATVDHIVPTKAKQRLRPFSDPKADKMLDALQNNCEKHHITFFGPDDEHQGIVHIIGPEQGFTQPGMTIVCGDSHTSTHGAFGALACGIGTTEVSWTLSTQSLFMKKPKVRRINVTGDLGVGVTAKDVILYIIGKLGVSGGKGYAYEFGGDVIDRMSMEERMTICNMTIEGGAPFGYVNPDQITEDWLFGRHNIPIGQKFFKLRDYWRSIRSNSDAVYDDVQTFAGKDIAPMVTWGTNPGQVVAVTEQIPANADEGALKYMGLAAGQKMIGTPIQHAFIGSCTNGRLTDLAEAADYITHYNLKVAPGVHANIVPGSTKIRKDAEDCGYDKIFQEAGFEWSLAGCSSCLGMNPDTIPAGETCISSSNRNFEGRQGKGARTILASVPVVVASAAAGHIVDPRTLVASPELVTL